jgi:hypothetical protein
MTVSLTPAVHPIIGQLDSLGLFLGLSRLNEERNAEYKQRLLDLFVNKANSSYRGVINGITRELGLSLFEALSLEPTAPALALGEPLIQFIDTKCTITSDFLTPNPLVIDRWEVDGGSYTLTQLIDTINDSGVFTTTLIAGVDEDIRAMTIFNQDNTGLVKSEQLKSATQVKLQNKNILTDTVVLSSDYITTRVSTLNDLTSSNQYYIDASNGIIYFYSAPYQDTFIWYKYRLDNFISMGSPVIISNLQSEDFLTKLYLQRNEQNQLTNGTPSVFGADIFNEIFSVFNTSFGQ